MQAHKYQLNAPKDERARAAHKLSNTLKTNTHNCKSTCLEIYLNLAHYINTRTRNIACDDHHRRHGAYAPIKPDNNNAIVMGVRVRAHLHIIAAEGKFNPSDSRPKCTRVRHSDKLIVGKIT